MSANYYCIINEFEPGQWQWRLYSGQTLRASSVPYPSYEVTEAGLELVRSLLSYHKLHIVKGAA